MSAIICKSQKLQDIITLKKGKPPAEQPYFGLDAELYLTPEYLRGKASSEPAKPSANAVRVMDGDTIVLWDGSNAGELFRARKGILASTMSLIEHEETFDKEYFFYAVKNWESYLKGQTSGSGIPHVDKEVIGKLEIFQFAESEQTKIAEILSTIDRAIEQTEALIAKQQRIKTGLMQDLLTCGIDEHGNLRSEETHEFKDSLLGRIPMEWEVKQLSTVVDLKVGYAFKSSLFSEDGIRLLRGENVGVGIPDWKDTRYLPLKLAQKFEEYQLNVGDMIIGMDRTFTKQGFKVSLLGEGDAPCILVQRVGHFVPMNVPRGFMQLLIQSPTYQKELLLQQKGMDIPHLSKSEILAPLVPIPADSDEMNTISNIIETAQSTEQNTTHNLNKLRSLKTALMQDLLTGKKRVTALLNETEVNV